MVTILYIPNKTTASEFLAFKRFQISMSEADLQSNNINSSSQMVLTASSETTTAVQHTW